MRHVLKNNAEVAHYWANQTQERGKAKTMFFEGKSIFSYGHHFEIARLVDVKGKTIVLFTSRDYSVTTSGHKSLTRSACSQFDRYTVPTFEDHAANVRSYLQSIEDVQGKAVRARTSAEFYQRDLKGYINAVREYVGIFKKHIPADLSKVVNQWVFKSDTDALFSPAELLKIKKAHAADLDKRKAEKEKRARAEAERRAELMERLEFWKQGGEVQLPYSYDAPVCLRVKEGRIQTSRGAEITVKTALRLWDHIKRNETVEGMPLDVYQVDKFDGETLKVGCHQIPFSEIKRMAEVLNV